MIADKFYTKKDYKNYISCVKDTIIETERRIAVLEKHKKIADLSYEDWVKWQKGELNLT